MKEIRLTEVQDYKMREAIRNASAVLNEIKCNSLEGHALNDMKVLESGVQHMEVFMLDKQPMRGATKRKG